MAFCLFRMCCCCCYCCRRKQHTQVDNMSFLESNVRVMAIYDFDRRYPDCLPFSRGDRMVVLKSTSEPWFKACHTTTAEIGMIPSNYVVKLEPRPENHEGWYDVVRREANFLLSNSGPGSFLLRPYVGDDACCTLSVCDADSEDCTLTQKHYKVFVDQEGRYRFCTRSSNTNFFQLMDNHKEPVKCDCGTVLTTHYVDVIGYRIWLQKIPRNKLTIDYSLGGGYFGEVWHGYLESVQVAVKKMRSDPVITPNNGQDLMNEARKLFQIKHPNVVHLLGICMDDGPTLLVMEYLSRGSLHQYLRKDAGNYITFSRICNMLSQVCDGMDYVGKKLNLVHRDLRAANILVSESLTVKIADFGLARDSEYLPTTFQLPIRWTAPEAFYEDGNSVKADVWSFGILTYEALTYGRYPYENMSKAEVKDAVFDGYRLPNPHGAKILGSEHKIECPDVVYEQMLECWNREPLERPTFESLKIFFNKMAGIKDVEYVDDIH